MQHDCQEALTEVSAGMLICAIASKLAFAEASLTWPAGRHMPHNAELHAQGWSLSLPAACVSVRDTLLMDRHMHVTEACLASFTWEAACIPRPATETNRPA